MTFDDLYLPLAWWADANRGQSGEKGTIRFGLAQRTWSLAATPNQAIAFEVDIVNSAAAWNVDFSNFRTDALPAGWTLNGSGLAVPQTGSAAKDRDSDDMALSQVFAMMFRKLEVTAPSCEVQVKPATVTATGATPWVTGPFHDHTLGVYDFIELYADAAAQEVTVVAEQGYPAFVSDSGMSFDAQSAQAGTTRVQGVILGVK